MSKDINKPSCLDAAYERMAIDQGMNHNPVFPENIEYYKAILKIQEEEAREEAFNNGQFGAGA